MKINLQGLLKNKRDLLFYACIILNASIVFSVKYFPTQDSGAHAYNSNILYNLLFGDKEFYEKFFSINTELVPNLTSHVVMMMFNAFLPFSVAEKLTVLIYFISFPLLFKTLISKFNEHKTYLIFLIFPFTHFCVLYYGFYNFAYGILFFILGIIYWVSNRDSFKVKQIVLFFLISTLCYFSHLVAFISLILFCSMYEAMDFLLQLKHKSLLEIAKQKSILFLKAIVSLILPLVLVFLYFRKRPSIGNESFYSIEELNNIILNGHIFGSYRVTEEVFCRALFYVLVFVFIYALISKIIEYKIENPKGRFVKKTDVFLLLSFVFLYLFYTQPNSDGYGGYISLRLSLIAHLIMTIWACTTIKKDIKFEIVTLLIVLFLNYKIFEEKKQGISWMNGQFKKFDKAMEKVKDGGIAATVFLADNYNWMGGHFSNYLGADKKVILLDNYEATTGYFPVVWKNPYMPTLISGLPSSVEECVGFSERLIHYPFGKIDYVIVYGRRDEDVSKRLMAEIEKNFNLESSYEDVFLYKRSK
jgi:hypothetical protein